MRWEFLREEEFPAAIEKAGGLCVLPIGCLEMHGQHLPVGTDSLKAQALVERAAEKTGAVVFPTGLWLGDVIGAHKMQESSNKMKHGYIALSPNLLQSILTELCDEIARNGFRKILIVSSHGGNNAMLAYLLRSLDYNKRDYAVMTTKVWLTDLDADKILEKANADPEGFSMLTEEDYKVLAKFAETGAGGGHACFRETGLIYGLYPELVAPDRYEAVDGITTHKGDYLYEAGLDTGAAWALNCPNAYSGFPPHGCSHTIGLAMVKIVVDRLTKIFELIQNDENCVNVARGIPEYTPPIKPVKF